MVCVCVTFFGYENSDIRNHPRISSRIIVIIRSFGGRDGSDKIDVRWGTNIYLCNVEKQSLQTRFTQWYLSKMGRNSPIFDFETRTATILTEVGSHYIW